MEQHDRPRVSWIAPLVCLALVAASAGAAPARATETHAAASCLMFPCENPVQCDTVLVTTEDLSSAGQAVLQPGVDLSALTILTEMSMAGFNVVLCSPGTDGSITTAEDTAVWSRGAGAAQADTDSIF